MVPSSSHENTMWQQHTKWISTCKAIVHMCNEVIDWVVRSECFSLWIWTSSITFTLPSLSRLPKVCLLLLCTFYISYYDLKLHRKPKITTLILTIDHEAILQLITNYSYSNFCYSYFCLCVDHCMFLCRSPCRVWRSLFLETEKWKVKRVPTDTCYSELFQKINWWMFFHLSPSTRLSFVCVFVVLTWWPRLPSHLCIGGQILCTICLMTWNHYVRVAFRDQTKENVFAFQLGFGVIAV